LPAKTRWLLAGDDPPSEVLLRTPVAPLSGGQSVSLYFVVVGALSVALVEVLAGAVLVLGGAVEVVEHEVHVLPLFSLQVVLDVFVPVHLDLDVGVRLPRKRPRLRELRVVLSQW